MRGRGSSGMAGNPMLIGAATVLVVLVAVFLAYNANQGLPFVPTYGLKADVPSGANLVRGNEVRVGGARVGTVERIEARRRRDGTSYARLVLKLDKAVDPLPRDSTIAVRSKSALGLKYVEIDRGDSPEGFADGATMSLSASQPQVEFDEVINTFDDRTRAGIQGSLDGFGTALAGRGAGLNAAIGAFRPLLRDLVPVAQNLSSRSTDLRGLVRGLGRAAAEVGPVAEEQAELFSNLDTTFTALNGVARPHLQDSISESAPALDAATRSFRIQRPFLRNTAGLFAELRPGARALRTAAPSLSEALEVGTPTLLRAPAFNERLEPVFTTLEDFAEDPAARRGIRRLSGTAKTLRPTLEFIAPAQTVCNYVSLFFRNTASLLSDGDANGTWQRFNIIATPQGPNNEGLPSSKPANGPSEANHLHSNPYPNTAAPGQPKECEAGNEVYERGKTTIGNVPGTQSATTEVTP